MKLSTQFSILTSIYITTVFIGVALFQADTLSESFKQQQYEWSKALTVSLAETLASDIINGKAVAVHEILQHIVASNNEIAYAYVSDFDHLIFSHTFSKGFPFKLLEQQQKKIELQNSNLSHTESPGVQSLTLDGLKIIDIGFPVIKGMNSHLHLGINQSQHKALLSEMFTELTMMFIVATISGIFFSLALAGYLVRPLGDLSKQLKVFGEGDEVNLTPVLNASQEIQELESNFKSMILARQRMENELEVHREHLEELVKEKTFDFLAARDEAEKASLAKSEFLSRMSHELRTPMNAILGFGQMLELDADELNQTQQDNVKEILDAGQHLLNLINEVLDLAKIESGHVDVFLEDIKLEEVITDSLQMIRPLAQKRGIEIKLVKDGIDISTERFLHLNATVWADKTRLRQVFINILSNAVKYNCENGKINVSYYYTADKKVHISISDTGKGLSLKEQEDIFCAFNRLGAEKTEIEGTGIGLVITKNIVELMGGSIGVTSTVDQGSTFWIELELLDTN